MIQAKSNSTPNWLNSSLYPFTSHFAELTAGRMHYLDEGDGETLLFVHGTPTWSFLYRHLIKELSANYRCIAPDHLGFGLSDKPTDFTASPAAHAALLGELVDQLGLEKVTLVVHDFGGPIGLGWAHQNAAKVERVILFNSWLWATKNDRAVQKIDRLINSRLGRWLYLGLNFSPRVLLKKGYANPRRLSKEVHRHYLKPFARRAERWGPYRLAQALAGSSDWYEQQWQQLNLLEEKPWLILWGEGDDFLGADYLARWRQRLPQATVYTMADGHFLMEENPDACRQKMESFLAGSPAQFIDNGSGRRAFKAKNQFQEKA